MSPKGRGKMIASILELRNISIKWKLLIPFLFLPAALTALLVVWGIRSQSQLLGLQEESGMRRNYTDIMEGLNLQLESAKALAILTAAAPEVQKALAEKNREELLRRYLPVFEELKASTQINLFHFHTYPARSLLRLHRPEHYGEDLQGYRQTILKTHETGQAAAGVEFGLMGFSLRGVAPVYYEQRLVGTVEAGISLSQDFLEKLKTEFGADVTLYVPSNEALTSFRVLSTTTPRKTMPASRVYREVMHSGKVRFLTVSAESGPVAVLCGPLKNFKGESVAVLEMTRARTDIISLLEKYRELIIIFGLILLCLALVFVWWISSLFLAPIDAMARQCEKITAGEKVPRIEVAADDEFGVLAKALNNMLAGLEESRFQLEHHAHELEAKVQERTAELVQSEEKFRTLLEHIPLVVYRLENSLIRTFISSYIEGLTGRPAESLVGPPAVWLEAVHPQDRDKVLRAKTTALRQGGVFELEYRLLDQAGQEVHILDHAEPVRDEDGASLYLEGYLLDIRERKRLQDQTVQAEELKTLGEISARLAHEFRNPLSVVGLAARRLTKKLDKDDPACLYVDMLLEQVARLEQIINMIQSYIKPMGLKTREVDSNVFFRGVAEAGLPFIRDRQTELNLGLPDLLPRLNIDPDLLQRALVNLIRNAAYQMPPRGRLNFVVTTNKKTMEIKMTYPAGYLPDDQLRHFFYPFTTEEADRSLVDLPLTPVIVHKHNGIINVGRETEDLIAVTITLPLA
ncbi:MAG: cache domain-containing protein [Pseudomonadota bacterium]